LSSR
jgi:hypothetical protein